LPIERERVEASNISSSLGFGFKGSLLVSPLTPRLRWLFVPFRRCWNWKDIETRKCKISKSKCQMKSIHDVENEGTRKGQGRL
jgi:hypothetical protein